MSAQNSKPETGRKRGKLNLTKCDFCRKDKQRCEPVTRVWPQKCVRCETKDFPCSPNSRKRTRILGPEHLAPSPREPGVQETSISAFSSIQAAPSSVSLVDETSTPSLTVLSNAVSLYKLLQRGAVEAERHFESLSRIGESVDEIKDCNSHIYVAAGKLKTRILEIISARLQQLSDAQTPRSAFRVKSNMEKSILGVLSSHLLDNSLPVGGSRYRSAGRHGSEHEQVSIRAVIGFMEEEGEVGAALLLHDEGFEQWAEASTTVVKELLTESFRLQSKFGRMIQPLLEELRVELPPDTILAFDWRYHALDFLGTTILHFLIEHLNSSSSNITTPISSDDRARFIAKIAAHDFSSYEAVDTYQRTPLHIAAQWNVVDVAVALLKSGMHPDLVTNTQRTALHYAASLGHTEMCCALLDLGADINAQTRGGNTPLMVAVIRPNETYKAFLRHSKVDIHIMNHQSDSALHMAVDQGNIAAVEDLLPKCDKIINYRNKEGETAISLAAQLDDHGVAVKLLSILLQSEFIKPSLRDNFLMTPLHHAVLEGNLDACKLFATRVDGGLYDEMDGETASELAERRGHMEIYTMLKRFENRAEEAYGSDAWDSRKGKWGQFEDEDSE